MSSPSNNSLTWIHRSTQLMIFQSIGKPWMRALWIFLKTTPLNTIHRYVEGHWTSAIDQFKSLLQRQFADDGPCKVIIKFMWDFHSCCFQACFCPTESVVCREMFGSTAPDDWKGCSEIAMLESMANIRDIYNLPYWINDLNLSRHHNDSYKSTDGFHFTGITGIGQLQVTPINRETHIDASSKLFQGRNSSASELQTGISSWQNLHRGKKNPFKWIRNYEGARCHQQSVAWNRTACSGPYNKAICQRNI